MKYFSEYLIENSSEPKVTTKAIGHGYHDVFVDGKKIDYLEAVISSHGGGLRRSYSVYSTKTKKTVHLGSLINLKRSISKHFSGDKKIQGLE